MQSEYAYLLICTGRYKELFSKYYESWLKYVKTDNCHLYIFTDDTDYFPKENFITYFKIEHSVWPNVVLKKYHYIYEHREALLKHKYIICNQANMVYLKTPEFKLEENKLMVCEHAYNRNRPGKLNSDGKPFTMAYINKPYRELCSGLFGGDSKAVIEACEILVKWANHDMKHGNIPNYHDESWLNAYAANIDPPRTVMPYYTMYPEEGPYLKSEKATILLRDKIKFFGTTKDIYSK